ncbi:MAG: transposase IS4 [Spirochaetes bacterium]|nr:MAG: transposase IS4 [Spirochaetota bacterium]
MSKARIQRIKNIDYVYIETSHRVPGRKYPDHTRLYIGKMHDSLFIPNEKFFTLTAEQKESSGLSWNPSAEVVSPKRGRPFSTTLGLRKFKGTDLLLSSISTSLNLSLDLERVFGERSRALLSLIYYLVANPDAPLYRFSQWARLHYHPYGSDLTSPRSSELLGSITEDEIQRFLNLRIQRASGTLGWLAVDATSISSYSQALSLVARGHNKDHNRLEQVNLLMVFDQDNDIPVFYRILRGNIPDVSTVETTLQDLRGVGIEGASLVLDRGFYSEDNVKALLKKRYSFTLGTKNSLLFVKDAIDRCREAMLSLDSYDTEHKVFHAMVPVSYAVPVRGREPTIKDVYLHIYCSKEREASEVAALMKRLDEMRRALASGALSSPLKPIETYFSLTWNKRGTLVSFSENVQAIKEAMHRCGFFALLTSEKHLNSSEVLAMYRHKDRVEKAFNNLKDRLALRRTRCSNDANFNGKVFVQFVALSMVSHIRNVMREYELFKKYTYRQILDEIDVIEYFEYPGKAGNWAEITVKQGQILRAFNVDLPIDAWPKIIRKEILKEQKAKKKSPKLCSI